jgi:flagellar motor protein MotB
MHRIWVVLVMLSFIAESASGQERLSTKNRAAIKYYEDARSHYGGGRQEKALEALYFAIEKDADFIEAYLVLGDIYNSQSKHQQEMEVLIKAVEIDSTFFPMTLFNIGVAAVKSGNYAEAIDWLEKFKWLYSDQRNADQVKVWLERARFSLEAIGNAYDIELVSAGTGVNSDYDEYWPSITADEQTLVFTVLVPRNEELFRERELPKSSLYFQEDFYFSHKGEDGLWQERVFLPGSINTDGNEGAQTLSADGNWMFITACGRADGRGSCDIYFSQWYGTGWSQPVNLGMPVNTPYWESQPTFSADGKTLIFVSNRPGGRGGKDIWQATIQSINKEGVPLFGDLRNLGPNINTSKDENSPFIHHDNKTLYFASDGWAGMGGMDLQFSRKMENGEWRPPVNLGYPINTPGDEIGLVINARGNRAYFSSDGREDGVTATNIYMFDLPDPIRPDPVLYVKGRVYDIETGETLPADFELKDLASGEVIVSTQSNRFSGEFLVCLPVGGKYAFKADHPGYMFYSGHFDLPEGHSLEKPYRLDIGLQPVRAGAKMVLENIFFELDSYDLRAESKIELDGLVDFLRDNSTVSILIGGHTDNLGQAAYNQSLSENRAKSVYTYLINGGVDASRLKYQGFGMNQPIADNDSEEGRAKNRRTEITIL